MKHLTPNAHQHIYTAFRGLINPFMDMKLDSKAALVIRSFSAEHYYLAYWNLMEFPKDSLFSGRGAAIGPQGHIRKIYICSLCRCIGDIHCVQVKRSRSSLENKKSHEDEALELLSQEVFV